MAELHDYVFGVGDPDMSASGRDPFAPEQLTQADYDRIQYLAEGGAAAEWLDVPSVALYLGVSKWTIYRAIKRGGIPSVRIGRVIRINKRALDEAMRAWSSGGE